MSLRLSVYEPTDLNFVEHCRQSRKYRETHGNYPPEEILRIGQVGGILAPIGKRLPFSAIKHVEVFAYTQLSVPKVSSG